MKKSAIAAMILSTTLGWAQSKTSNDTAYVQIIPLPAVELDEVQILGTWASKNQPIAQINLAEKDVESINTGRDLPYVLQDVAGVVSFSDAGNGVGYTNMRVRGSDITRINVTVNGIPMNDAESHSVFWVNTPDLMSSTNALQLQKGVGSSSNGSGAFGATLGMSTLGAGQKGGRVTIGGGSYNTQRFTAQASTGLSKDGFWMNTRLSRITSDGYVDRASSDLNSYYLSGGFSGGGHFVELVRFGGGERTYQAWWGIDSTTMYGGAWPAAPTTNYAGALYDDAWNVIGTYNDQVDNYSQEHTQLHYRFYNLFGGTFAAALHHTGGAGYYEEYNQGYDFADFGLPAYISGLDTVAYGDVVSRKWLDNDFYGATASWVRENDGTQWVLGGGAHRYDGDHFGKVIWANHPDVSAIDNEYYRGIGQKDDANVYGKWTRSQNNVLFYADAQYRYVNHDAEGGSASGEANFNRTFHFFNPKAGLTYDLPKDQILGAYVGMSHREPNRTDLQYAADPFAIKAERMLDVELTYKGQHESLRWDLNAYHQQYQNQLVLTGEIDNQGYAIRKNVGNSFRRGLEGAFTFNLTEALEASANVALSQNINQDFISHTGSSARNTTIAFSPAMLAGGRLTYAQKGIEASLWNQFVSKQYISNEGLEAHTLPSYHIANARLGYTFEYDHTNTVQLFFEARNLANTSYAANGYMWGATPYYYAQATRNYMFGLTFMF
ncbi:MAG: hypothetical protein RL754_1163 [Bacteroidota bacterium]